jgi:hypothetical protein
MTAGVLPSMILPTAFTCRYAGKSSTLTSDVEIFPAHMPSEVPPQGAKYKALYDTGATHSAISPRVVEDLKLASIGATIVGVGGGPLTTTSHVVNIGLPNRVMFSMFRVSKMKLHGGIDAIIGMDILGMGDFAVTNHKGRTTFSFCCPSQKEIDFVSEVKESAKVVTAHSDKIGRNSPCPCGSGKKYKKCCGKGIA